MGSELHWLAFRYVAGELTPAEADGFERRLAHDQAAREAVAEAVALIEGVASLPAETLERLPVRRRWPRRVAIRVAALAAGVLAAVGAYRLASRPDEPVTASAPRAVVPPARQVALIWSGLRQEERCDPEGDELMSWLDESARAPEPEALAAADPGDSAHGMPGWLWEAASLPRPGGPSSPVSQEN